MPPSTRSITTWGLLAYYASPHALYNIAATTCHLGDIFDTFDSKTNEKIQDA